MIYLYAITEELDGPLEALRGVDYASLDYLHRDGLTAVVSRVNEDGLLPTPRRLWQHEQVVEALMVEHPVLPVRFSTVFPDETTVEGQLTSARARIESDLDRLRGCVELSLRVIRLWEPYVGGDGAAHIPCPEPVHGASPSTIPLHDSKESALAMARRAAALQRQANRQRNGSLATLINRPLEALAVDHTLHVEHTAGVLIKSAYLVERRRLGEMQQAVRRLMHTYPNLHFLCTGPWPPYHFTRPIQPALARAS